MNNTDSQNGPPPNPPAADERETLIDLAASASPGSREPPARERVPPAIPDHELLRCIGRGSYGEVWLARNVMGAYRAVKIVYRDIFDSDRPYEREYHGIQKFEPISRRHESQVDILHVGRNDQAGYFYYVMELADAAGNESEKVGKGVSETDAAPPSHSLTDSLTHSRGLEPTTYVPKTLRSELKRRHRLPCDECLDIALSLTTALEHLHAHGLIHRDIKPANIIFVEGLPKLADIGLVAETGKTMSFVGTEGYLPPEGPGSVLADIFSLGKVLYEICTGKDRLEFPEMPTFIDTLPEKTDLFEFNEVLLKACKHDVRKRYQTAAQMHEDLLLLKAGKSVKRSHALERRLAVLTKVSVAGVTVTALVLGGFFYQQAQTQKATRLAQAETFQRTRAEGLLNNLQLKTTELELKQAENFFENDEAGKGVAYLARMLRQDPSNHVAAGRLMAALTDRSFPLPIRVFEHTENLHDADFGPEGQRIVTGAGNDSQGEAKIWDVRTGDSVGKPMRHDKAVLVARFSPNGRFVVTASRDGTVRLWDAATGEPVTAPLLHHEPGKATPPEVLHAEFSPDGKTFVTGAASKVRVWKVPTGESVTPPIDHGTIVTSVQVSPDGQRLLTTADDLMTKVWDASTGKLQFELKASGKPVNGRMVARFSPDGSRIAATSGDDVCVWSANTGELLHRLHHEVNVVSVHFSPDGLRIATGDLNRTARVWDAQTGQLLLPPLPHKDVVEDVQFDATGERLLTLEWRRGRIWDSRTGRPLTEWLEEVYSVRFSPDGLRVLAKAGDGKTAILWDVRAGQALNVALQHQTAVPSAKFNRDGDKVITAAGGDVFFRSFDGPMSGAAVWDARSGELITPRIKTTSGVQYAEFSPDGRKIVTALKNGQAQVWDARTGAPVTEPLKHNGHVQSARFSPDGGKVVTASDDKTARIWDAQTGQPLTDPLEHSKGVWFAQFSPDGRWVLTSGRHSTVRIWDARTGQLRLELSDGDGIMNARFSPDGKHIVTAAPGPRTARIWDSQTGKPVGEPMKHQSTVWCGYFSPDGQYIVTASDDQGSRVWDARTGKPVSEPLMHKQEVLSAEFSPDSSRVVTASTDGTARVWDARTGRPLTEPLRHNDCVNYAEFNPDGNRVITASADGTARIWELPPADVPVPAWVLDLGEAIVGRRFVDQDKPEPVPPTQLLVLRKRILEANGTDRYTAWAKWLLADRFTRNTSPSSSIIAAKHLDRLIAEDSVQTLREALQFSPDNALATARLAQRILNQETVIGFYKHPKEEGKFLAERAVKLNSNESEAPRAKAAVLKHTD